MIQTHKYLLIGFVFITAIVLGLAKIIYSFSCNVFHFIVISTRYSILKPFIPEKSLQELGKNIYEIQGLLYLFS
jgi:hypothetical protein